MRGIRFSSLSIGEVVFDIFGYLKGRMGPI